MTHFPFSGFNENHDEQQTIIINKKEKFLILSDIFVLSPHFIGLNTRENMRKIKILSNKKAIKP
jgi:hypothetical protein